MRDQDNVLIQSVKPRFRMGFGAGRDRLLPRGHQGHAAPWGLHAVGRGRPARDTCVLFKTALKRRISIAPGRRFTQLNQFNNCLRLSYGLPWTSEVEVRLRELGQRRAAVEACFSLSSRLSVILSPRCYEKAESLN